MVDFAQHVHRLFSFELMRFSNKVQLEKWVLVNAPGHGGAQVRICTQESIRIINYFLLFFIIVHSAIEID